MSQDHCRHSPDTTTVGVLPVQEFTSRAIPAHEENPVRPRLGRPTRRVTEPAEGAIDSADNGTPPVSDSTPEGKNEKG